MKKHEATELLDFVRNTYLGIRTPGGKAKKPPWTLLVWCPSCREYALNTMKLSMGERFRCQRRQYHSRQGSNARPDTLFCGHVVSFVPIQGMKKRTGLTVWGASRLRNTWLRKHGRLNGRWIRRK